MKRVLTIVLALTLTVCSIPVAANAITPALKIPSMPTIPSFKVNIELPQSVFDDWFAKNPIELPTAKIPNTPSVTEAKYYHDQYSRLQIRWNKVDGADNYEIEITKADGSKEVYETSSNSLIRSDVDCPRVYIEETSTWTAATVRVRAVDGNVKSLWSESVNVGCNMLH
jgi:hypothetical protein